MAFNLKEYILFREEIKRELFNVEVDENFKAVSNPWVDYRRYETGQIVYHPVEVEKATGSDISTGEPEEYLTWWRANTRTTLGVFDMTQWDIIGGVGGFTNITIAGGKSFGKILANWNAPFALPWNMAADGLLEANGPTDTFKITAGTGINIGWNQAEEALIIENSGAMGEVNNGVNIGTAPGVSATGIDGPYAGMVGLNLSFYGLHARNDLGASPGNALSATLDINDNLVYNLDQGEIDLAELNFGCPTLDLLCDVSYISGTPTAGDLLQWNGSEWITVPISIIGALNIYTTDSTITNSIRTATLNGAGGYLRFAGNGGTLTNPGLGINNDGEHFRIGENSTLFSSTLLDINANDALDFQIRLTNSASPGNASINLVSGTGVDYIMGINDDPAASPIPHLMVPYWSLNRGSSQDSLLLDDLSLDQDGDLWVNNWGIPASVPFAIEHYLPFAAPRGDSQGKTYTELDLMWTYDGTDGTSSNAKTLYVNVDPSTDSADSKAALRIANVPNEGTSDINFTIIASGISTPSTSTGGEIITGILYGVTRDEDANLIMNTAVGMYNGLDQSVIGFESTPVGAPTLATELSIGFGSKMGQPADSQFGVSSIVLSDAVVWSGSTRIGIFADVVNDYADFVDVSDTGTWAGFFRGCVNITEGGLRLDPQAIPPSCNGNLDETLWINSVDGHVYRGNVDLEDIGGLITLCDLADVDCPTGGPADGDIIEYDAGLGVWVSVANPGGGQNIYNADGTQTDSARTYTGLGVGSTLNFDNLGTYSIEATRIQVNVTNTSYQLDTITAVEINSGTITEINSGTSTEINAATNFNVITGDGQIFLDSNGFSAQIVLDSAGPISETAFTNITVNAGLAIDITAGTTYDVTSTGNATITTTALSGADINLDSDNDVDIDAGANVTVDAVETIILTADVGGTSNQISLVVGTDVTDFISIETQRWSSLGPLGTTTDGPPLIAWNDGANDVTEYAEWTLPNAAGADTNILQYSTALGGVEWVAAGGGGGCCSLQDTMNIGSTATVTTDVTIVTSGEIRLESTGDEIEIEAMDSLKLSACNIILSAGDCENTGEVGQITIASDGEVQIVCNFEQDVNPGDYLIAKDDNGNLKWGPLNICGFDVDCPTGGPAEGDTLVFNSGTDSWDIGLGACCDLQGTWDEGTSVGPLSVEWVWANNPQIVIQQVGDTKLGDDVDDWQAMLILSGESPITSQAMQQGTAILQTYAPDVTGREDESGGILLWSTRAEDGSNDQASRHYLLGGNQYLSGNGFIGTKVEESGGVDTSTRISGLYLGGDGTNMTDVSQHLTEGYAEIIAQDYCNGMPCTLPAGPALYDNICNIIVDAQAGGDEHIQIQAGNAVTGIDATITVKIDGNIQLEGDGLGTPLPGDVLVAKDINGNVEWGSVGLASICGFGVDCPTGGPDNGDSLIFNSSTNTWDIGIGSGLWEEGSGMVDILGGHTMTSGFRTDYSIIAGGQGNEIIAPGISIATHSAILGGKDNIIHADNQNMDYSAIIGGFNNVLGVTAGSSCNRSVIIGGHDNVMNAVGGNNDCVIVGGNNQTVGFAITNTVFMPAVQIGDDTGWGTPSGITKFRLADGTEQAGYILTCDVNGDADWQAPGGGGDGIYGGSGTVDTNCVGTLQAAATTGVSGTESSINFTSVGSGNDCGDIMYSMTDVNANVFYKVMDGAISNGGSECKARIGFGNGFTDNSYIGTISGSVGNSSSLSFNINDTVTRFSKADDCFADTNLEDMGLSVTKTYEAVDAGTLGPPPSAPAKTAIWAKVNSNNADGDDLNAYIGINSWAGHSGGGDMNIGTQLTGIGTFTYTNTAADTDRMVGITSNVVNQVVSPGVPGGTVENAFNYISEGHHAASPTVNAYGLYLEGHTTAATGSIAERWGIYQEDSNDLNYFAGATNFSPLTTAVSPVIQQVFVESDGSQAMALYGVMPAGTPHASQALQGETANEAGATNITVGVDGFVSTSQANTLTNAGYAGVRGRAPGSNTVDSVSVVGELIGVYGYAADVGVQMDSVGIRAIVGSSHIDDSYAIKASFDSISGGVGNSLTGIDASMIMTNATGGFSSGVGEIIGGKFEAGSTGWTSTKGIKNGYGVISKVDFTLRGDAMDNTAVFWSNGVRLDGDTAPDDITNAFGIFLGPHDDSSNTGDITNKFGVFQKGAEDKNDFEGPMRFRDTSGPGTTNDVWTALDDNGNGGWKHQPAVNVATVSASLNSAVASGGLPTAINNYLIGGTGGFNNAYRQGVTADMSTGTSGAVGVPLANFNCGIPVPVTCGPGTSYTKLRICGSYSQINKLIVPVVGVDILEIALFKISCQGPTHTLDEVRYFDVEDIGTANFSDWSEFAGDNLGEQLCFDVTFNEWEFEMNPCTDFIVVGFREFAAGVGPWSLTGDGYNYRLELSA